MQQQFGGRAVLFVNGAKQRRIKLAKGGISLGIQKYFHGFRRAVFSGKTQRRSSIFVFRVRIRARRQKHLDNFCLAVSRRQMQRRISFIRT